jgi:2-keto-4-pentenoate hydratase
MSASEKTGVGVATIEALADALLVAEMIRRPVGPLSQQFPELTVAEAYEIQSINARSRVVDANNPTTIVGHKIGLTSRAMQEMLGVAEPDYGVLYGDRVLENGASIAANELIAPRVEPEIAFVLAAPLAGPGVTPEQVLAATEYVLPALEVIDSRIADWKISLTDTIADNASCARVVLGDTRAPIEGSVLAAAMVDLRVSGQNVDHGCGAAVLGHPAKAVAWLANALAEHDASLQAGHLVMPGSLTAAVPFTAGEHVVADFGRLGVVEAFCA